MKKITLLFLGTIHLMTFAQTQRTVLLEEFTQASCPQCAAANPTFNKFVANNANKLVSIKYQTSWPGVDPMNAQNKGDVATRVTYYNVSTAPSVSNDGKPTEAPAAITQTKVDDEYNIASPFKLSITHQIDSTTDSILIISTITAAQDFTTKGPLYFRLALVEKAIKFIKAPGENGEKEFFSVMRKMIPSATGTSLALNWTKDHSEKIVFKIVVPSYIYDRNQLSVVGFLQTDNNKTVLQATESASAITGIFTTASSKSTQVFVYPNPANSEATINLQLFESSKVTLQLANSLCQQVLTKDLGTLEPGEQTLELNITQLPPGFYFLNISLGKEVISKKIAINR